VGKKEPSQNLGGSSQLTAHPRRLQCFYGLDVSKKFRIPDFGLTFYVPK
jgi:hypothetical protein